MFDRVRQWFSPETITVDPADAADVFTEHRGDDLAAAREDAAELQGQLQDALDAVDDALQDVDAASLDDDPAMVQDVVTNFVRERRQLLDRFEPGDDLDALQAAVADLVDEFQTMTQKEAAVIDKSGGVVGDVFNRFSAVRDVADKIDRFHDGQYSVVQQYKTLQDQLDELDRLEEERSRLEAAIADHDPGAIRDRIEETEAELERLRDRDAWDELAAVQDDIADLEDERDRLEGRLEAARNAMERGLKKIVYAAEQGNLALDRETTDVLAALRDGDIGATDTVEDAVDAAVAAVRDGDVLDETEVDAFTDAADELQELGAVRDRLDAIDDELEERSGAAADFDIRDEEAALEEELEELRQRLEDAADTRSQHRQRLRAVEEELRSVRERIRSTLDDALRADVALPED